MSNNCVPCGQRARNMQAPPASQPAQNAVQPSPAVRAPVTNNAPVNPGPRIAQPRHFFNGTK